MNRSDKDESSHAAVRILVKESIADAGGYNTAGAGGVKYVSPPEAKEGK